MSLDDKVLSLPACAGAWEHIADLQLRGLLCSHSPEAEHGTLSPWLQGPLAWAGALHPSAQDGGQAVPGFLCQIPKLVAGVLLACSGNSTDKAPSSFRGQSQIYSPKRGPSW